MVDLTEFSCFYQFLHYVIIKLFCFDVSSLLSCTILYLFSKIWKYHPQIRYFSNFAEIFSTALTAKSAQNQKGTRFECLYVVLGIYNFWYGFCILSNHKLTHIFCFYSILSLAEWQFRKFIAYHDPYIFLENRDLH